MPELKRENPGDREAMESLRQGPIVTETAGERNERLLRVYGSILLVLCILAVLLWLGLWIRSRIQAVEHHYGAATQQNDQTMRWQSPGPARDG